MEKAKSLALKFMIATHAEDIGEVIRLAEEISKLMETYKRSC